MPNSNPDTRSIATADKYGDNEICHFEKLRFPIPFQIRGWRRRCQLAQRSAIFTTTLLPYDNPVMSAHGGLMAVPGLSLIWAGSESAACASVPGAAMPAQA